ncbi:MAG: DUF3800 domain-containing protein [Acholeplasmataceae bacterium]|jgi:hypothetical protein|nr:DUF3800 domain-containing protein [Lascolabacillus sp.]
MPEDAIYIFLDEGGNFDFSPRGTKFFTLTSVLKRRPFNIYGQLTELRFDLIENGLDIEYFHAAENKQAVRDKVFEVIKNNADRLLVDSVVVEKRKTGPALQPPEKFYPRMLGYLLRYVVERIREDYSELIVITDVIPVEKKRRAIEKAIKQTLSSMLPNSMQYRVLHHASKSSASLQVADYCNWAIFRAWERSDRRSLDLITEIVRSQFNIFRGGTRFYY